MAMGSSMVRLPALGRPCTRRFRSAKPSFARRRILALQAARRQPAVLLRTPALDLRRPSDVVHDFGSVRGRAGRGAPERKRRPFCFCNGPADVKSPRVIVKPPSSRFCPWLALRPPHYAVRAARTEVTAYKLKLAVRFAVWSNSGQPPIMGLWTTPAQPMNWTAFVGSWTDWNPRNWRLGVDLWMSVRRKSTS